MKTLQDLEQFLLRHELNFSVVRGARGEWSACLHFYRIEDNIAGVGLHPNLIVAIEEAIATYVMKHKKSVGA